MPQNADSTSSSSSGSSSVFGSSFALNVIKKTKTWASEYPRWWASLSHAQKYFPVISVLTYWLLIHLLDGFRGDHLTLGIIILLFSYLGANARSLLRFFLPLILTGIVYDSQRFYGDYLRAEIHVNEPYNFDKYFFGIETTNGVVLTPNEWFQQHLHWFWDLLFGFYYLTFFLLFVLIAAYFYFWLSKKGTSKMSKEAISLRAPRVMWAFFWLNIIGYSTYYWYPAAPPWYVTDYGLGPANLSAQASTAGCLRFDQLLGTSFFTQLYGRAADVFGAIPSLHVAYPLLAVYYAFQFGSLRIFSSLFFIIMSFAAVYLNHHYVLDIIWGSGYALLTGFVVDYIYNRNMKKTKPSS